MMSGVNDRPEQHRDEARDEREDLGNDPGADREIVPAQPKQRDRNRYGQ